MEETQRKQQDVPRKNGWLLFFRALIQDVKKIRKRRVPFVQQMNHVECGHASLAMILSYYGRKTNVIELRTRYGVGRDALSALSIANAARDYGLRVRAISLQHTEFRHVVLPAIIHWEFDHFMIVERWSKRYVDIVDPALGRRRLTSAEFDAGFTGVVLMMEPGANFDRRSPPSSLSLTTYARQFIQQAPGAMLQVFLASALLQLFGLALPLVTAVLVDRIIPFKLYNVMTLLALGMVMLLCSQIVISLLRDWILVYLRARIDIHMMLNFFEHLLSLPYSFFLQRSAADLLTRMASNSVIRDVLSNQLISTLLDCSTVSLYFCILLSQSLPYTLLTLTIGILEVTIVLVTYRPVREVAKRELAAQGKAQGYLAEALSGIATLKAAGAESRAFERWSNLFFEQLNVSLRRSYLTTIAGTALSALRMFSSLALLWVGVQQVLQGSMSIGTMLALNTLAGTFLAPLSSLVSSAQQLQLVQAHLMRLADIMTTTPEQNRQEVVTPPRLTGHIRVENVGFQYAAGSPRVLQHISLSIRAGQKIAIVGRTGSGKSTLGRLLLGLYLPTEGTILYDGIPLQRMQLQDVRRQFGVVLQDSAIFSGTILQNITLNNPTMSREQAMRAAWMAAIHEDILRMPMRYDTQVSEGGAALSGGQRQRMSIARAIANNPSILLLDEATSHLDVLTEQRVARSLESIACTQIIIAHRLSTVRAADVILVMDNGTIVEYGSHRQLLRRNGHYAQLVRQQIEKGEHEKVVSRSSI